MVLITDSFWRRRTAVLLDSSMIRTDSLSLPQMEQEQEPTSTMTLVAEEHVLKRKAMRLSSMSMMPLAISQVW